jgi:hypothetical protein
MTITLTGAWKFLDPETTRQAEGIEEDKIGPRPGCQGPLCGPPEINVALRTKPLAAATASAPAVSTIFLAGFKLAPRYLDRSLYPLISFADIMLGSSLESTEPASSDSLSAIQLGGRPAYRLLAPDSESDTTHEVGYVVESNGYILVLVGAVSSAADLPKLQSSIEGLKFTSPSQ